ncbi:hypothetical protein P692DRAFT_201667912, partial [Suillus brevipes Sb2]
SDDNTSTESSAANMSSSDDSESDWDSSDDADDEAEHANSRLSQYVRCTYRAIYARRYDAARNKPIPKAPSQLPHILKVLKVEWPDEFREILRVNPDTFDKIVEKIKDDTVFFNNSNNPQQPVEEQLAITLYRFGHNGNAASQSQAARWAAGGHGTVSLNTKRVMTAILHRSFMDKAVRFPTLEEKEEAKTWVEKHSCKAWRDGWCLIDGTLIPLYDRPHWYGESYFNRKCNYSLNIQIVSLPNLRIIDFSYGHTGSTHDSTAWDDTRLCQEHDTLLDDEEFVWADSAYPLQTWVIVPYKK